MLRIEHLYVKQGERSLLQDVSLFIEQNKWVCLVGASGSGKSLLVKSILQMLPNTLQPSGTISWNGEDIQRASTTCSIYGCEIGYIPQQYTTSFAPFLTMDAHIRDLFVSHKQSYDADRIRSIMDKVHLSEELLHRYPGELSGGQLQRFSLVLASILQPTLLIADEITNALDVLTARQVTEWLKTMVGRTSSLLWVTHDLAEAMMYADYILVMKEGRIVDAGDRAQLLDSLNPYTKSLLKAAPILTREDRLEYVPTR
ncbi:MULTISPECIES: ATP-binding cassette domain-containing protein [Exiguobacterium]|uniref:ATP-binding cassette domain-containing protein n=1 Tax=Exiguobacterium TaxID=33986 RepID=UPI001BED2439|nr:MULTISPECIES: ATP-binding cassette domain-containing protein [Exiguobacterium]MCT4783280.1 ATP-binding cassette domain-containing protein [Exiguobacterium himgiriensis]